MTKTAIIDVDGMSCAHCVRSVTGALQQLAGVSAVEVSLEQKTARVEYDDGRLAVNQLLQAVEQIGFTARHSAEVD